MAQNTDKLNVTELDFDEIKNSLKRYLNGQREFTDYDFESSGLSVVLDLLAYNTHYNAFYLNMLANESFLDSAEIRNSVVSLAKALGYTPKSVTGAIATVDLTFTPKDLGGVDSGTQTDVTRLGTLVNIPKGSVFLSELNSKTYSFVTTQSYTAAPTANTTGGYLQSDEETVVPYTVTDVKLVQGIFTSVQYIFNDQVGERFILPNPGVDTSTITLTVTDTASVTDGKIYTLVDDYSAIAPDSQVFFLQEGADERYEVYFGDGNAGIKPPDGAIVDISYVVSEGDAGNGSTIFLSDPIRSPYYGVGGSTRTYSATTTTTLNAFAGGRKEDIDSIKFLAPLNFEAQSRAVTALDYTTRLQTDYAQLDSAMSWGGEDNDPPEFGKVFISIKPKTGYILSEAEKESIITNILGTRNVIGVTPVIVDPDFVFLDFDIDVKWDSRMTTMTESTLRAIIDDAIVNYGQNTLEKFEEYFRYSPLLHTIDTVDPGITNNLVTVRLRKEFVPEVGVSANYTLDYSHKLVPDVLTSTTFTYAGVMNCVLSDNDGVIEIHGRLSTGESVIVSSAAGTIDYDTGQLILAGFLPTAVNNGGTLSIYTTPVSNDVVPKRNQLLTIKSDDIRIRMFDDASLLRSTIARAGTGQ